MTSLSDFNAEIREKIPALKLLGMEFVEFTPKRVRLTSGYAANRNHLNTVFGGSLYLAATAACYGLFRAMTEEMSAPDEYIILKSGAIDYLRPVSGDFEVIAGAERGRLADKIPALIARFGQGKLELTSQVFYNGQVCARFKGIFVLRKFQIK